MADDKTPSKGPEPTEPPQQPKAEIPDIVVRPRPDESINLGNDAYGDIRT